MDHNNGRTSFNSLAGLLNLRGSDIEANPVFFAYALLTLTELHLYILDKDRIKYNIENHFYVEGIEVIPKEYNTTLAGINNVVRVDCVAHFPFHFSFAFTIRYD